MPSRAHRLRRWLLGSAALLLGWVGMLAAVALLRTEPRTVAVLGPPSHGLRVLAATDQPLIDVGPWAVTTRASGTDAVRRLYAAGAWLVIEGSAGCGWIKGRNPAPTPPATTAAAAP
jgi:hypothetical protein